jgi:hypothetical protein
MFTKDDIYTLVNVIITDPIRMNLFPRSYTTQRFVSSDDTQVKEKNYRDQHPIDQFLVLAIEIFGCLHKQVNVLLHNCAYAVWRLKGFEGLHIYVWVIFLHQKISITLQRMQG